MKSFILPVQSLLSIHDPQYVMNINRESLELKSTREEANYMVCTLDAIDEKADLHDVVNKHSQHLSESQGKALLLLLMKFRIPSL